MKAPLIGHTINFDPSGDIMMGLFALGICFAIFLIGRAIVLWYWKVNKIVDLLERIESHLADGFTMSSRDE